MTDKTTTEIAPAAPTAIARPDYGIDVGRVVAMRAAVEEVIVKVLREGEHYGIIPGTDKGPKKPKKALLQPGAEVLSQVFRLRPEYQELSLVEREDFIAIKIRCRLFNTATGEQAGEAIGSANSREEKYVGQTTARVCPQCGKAAIIKGKAEYGGGYLCWEKKDGCGAKFSDDDKRMVQDQGGTVSTTKVWGLYHTLEAIAQKRAYVRAVRTATASSDIFTDEDAPADDDNQGAPQSTGPRTQTAAKPAAGPKVNPTDVQRLNRALTAAHIGEATDPHIPKAEQQEQTRKAKLGWVNGMLEDSGRTKVASVLEIPADFMAELIAKAEAEAGECPVGW